MSVIAFKVFEDKVQVAFDGIALVDDRIISNNFIKAYKLSDELIIGATGLGDTIGIFKKFVEANQRVFEKLDNVTDALPLMKRFRDYLEEYGYTNETVKEFGGLLVVNKHFHCVFYYDENTYYPYGVYYDLDKAAFGSSGIYTTALIDCGMELEEAIKRSAEKYTSINGNVTVLEISRV